MRKSLGSKKAVLAGNIFSPYGPLNKELGCAPGDLHLVTLIKYRLITFDESLLCLRCCVFCEMGMKLISYTVENLF